MAEEIMNDNHNNYIGQGVRGPLWAGFGVLTGGLVLNALSNLANGFRPQPPPPPPGQSADAVIAELKAQNFTLLQTGPMNAAMAAQGAQLAALQRTVDAVVRPMVPYANVAVALPTPVTATTTPASNG